MLDNLKKTATQTPTQTVIPATELAPTGEKVETQKPVVGVIRTRSANILERVGWTLGEAFVGSFLAVFFGAQKLGVDVLKAAAFAGGSAALAALGALVKNLIVTRGEG